MNTNNEQPSLSLRQLFEQDVYKVPVYQRNYDWGEAQIQQLVEDINDFSKTNTTGFYYIGSLVVHQKEDYFEVLDGQQRFTTLTLLMCYLKYRLPLRFKFYEKSNLGFESRPKSENSLNKLYEIVSSTVAPKNKPNEALLKLINGISQKDFNPSIVNGFKIVSSVIGRSIELEVDKKSAEDSLITFAEYLLSSVKILRVNVPKNTDVTHYFEVMNNRGEQLEKHEIIKADLLSAVQNNQHDMATIQKIWLACSDMNRYAQTRFSVAERKLVFEDNCEGFKYQSFDDLRDAILPNDDNEKPSTSVNEDSLDGVENTHTKVLTLDIALELGKDVEFTDDNKTYSGDDGGEERFTSVIDFPNFLMQVLRLYVKKELGEKLPPLDDKELIPSFKHHIGEDAKKAKTFVFTLLKLRYLFDRYIVKRERTSGKGEDWSLKHYKFDKNGSSYVNTFSKTDDSEADNESCLMLLSAFHVSYPTNSRKNWLSSVLYWLDQRKEIGSSKEYLGFLENLAKTFMVNRYLVNEPQDYLGFMYDERKEKPEVEAERIKDLLNYGNVRLFVFNYLDYLLWKDAETEIKSADGKLNYKSGFRFSTNNTIEHFSPQTPKANEKLESSSLHSFGNLCLLTNTENSSLNNDGPEQKAKILNSNRKSMAPLSLKLELMLKKSADWGETANKAKQTIAEHETEMLKILVNNLDIGVIRRQEE